MESDRGSDGFSRGGMAVTPEQRQHAHRGSMAVTPEQHQLSYSATPAGAPQQHRDQHQRRDPLWTHCMDSFLPL